jgi:hypothetical protein
MTEDAIRALTKPDKDKIRKAILEMSASMARTEAERELQKSILSALEDEVGLEKKIARRMAKVYHRATYSDEVEQNHNFEQLYQETVL